METDISKLHRGTDGFYYEDYIAPDKPETFVGKLVSTEWWHKGVRFALICNFQAVEKNTLWECEIRKTRTERCTWMSARQIVEPKTDSI